MKNFSTGRLGGFTLIELLVVVLIIGILSAVALPRYQAAVARARFSEVLTRSKTLENTLDTYLMESGFPQEDIDLSEVYPDSVGGLERVPKDPSVAGQDFFDWASKHFTYQMGCYRTGPCLWLAISRMENQGPGWVAVERRKWRDGGSRNTCFFCSGDAIGKQLCGLLDTSLFEIDDRCCGDCSY
ncbi:pilin [Candidatus Avelusimicrobium facis]|uniref:pilin n=1 Tax=Candidatus Avelusimicrobium facis TaxID=3416203 RepID=UPI003D0A5396